MWRHGNGVGTVGIGDEVSAQPVRRTQLRAPSDDIMNAVLKDPQKMTQNFSRFIFSPIAINHPRSLNSAERLLSPVGG